MDKPATPLPWHIVPYGDGDSLVICEDQRGDRRIAFMATPGCRDAADRKRSWKGIRANAAYIVTACNAYPHLTAINAELVEALDMARDLIQEAKGADGPNGGFVTDHLDAAQNWIDSALAALARAKENSNA